MPFKTIRRNSLASNLKHHTISRSAVLSIASITNRYQALATQCLPLLQTRSHTFAARTRAKLHYRLPFLEGYKMGLKKRKIVILGTGSPLNERFLLGIDTTITFRMVFNAFSEVS